MHFYNFNINDFNASTRHLSHLERAFYRDLIDMYYSTEKPITTDLAKLERLLLIKTDDEKQALQNVLADFFVVKKLKGDTAPCYHNARIDRELKNYKYRQTQSNDSVTEHNAGVTENDANNNEKITDSNGTYNAGVTEKTLDNNARQARYRERKKMVQALLDKGVSVNKQASFDDVLRLYITHYNEKITDSNGTYNAGVTENNTVSSVYNHKPITINHKPITNNISPQTPQGGESEQKRLNVAFDDFWDLYDKKQDRPKCERLWGKLTNQDRLDIMAYLPKYKQSQPDKQFRKNPQTFLNNRSWENEIIQATWQKPISRMDELRQMAATNPTNVYVNDLPQAVTAQATMGITYE